MLLDFTILEIIFFLVYWIEGKKKNKVQDVFFPIKKSNRIHYRHINFESIDLHWLLDMTKFEDKDFLYISLPFSCQRDRL